MNYDLLIAHFAKHITLTPADLDYILPLFQPLKVKRKTLLVKEGQVMLNTFYIVKGCLRSYIIDKEGVEHVSVLAIEDWWITDTWSYMTKQPAIGFVEALEDSELLTTTKEHMDNIGLKVPVFDRYLRIMFERAYMSQEQRILDREELTAEERYLRFRKKYPQFEQRIPQKQIASFLGITPEFLSMLRSKLRK